MKVSDLRYGGVPAWPPAWTSWVPMTRVLGGQSGALLVAITVKHRGVEMEITVDGDVVRGLLLWDDGPSPASVKQALDIFVDRPLREAADAHIPEDDRGRRTA